MGVKQAMQLLKAFVVGIIGLFSIMCILSLLIPSTVIVSRSVVVNSTDTSAIYQQIAHGNNWKNWHPIFKNTATTIQNDTVNNTCNIVINNTLTTLHILPLQQTNAVQFILSIQAELPIENTIAINTIPNTATTQISWYATNHFSWYPWQKFYAIFIDKLTGPSYDDALTGLKNYIEK
jgi:hypothetical protein